MPAAHSRWRNGTDANRSRGTRRSRRVLFSGDAKLSAAGVLARSFSVWRAKVPHRGRSQINRRCQRSSIVMERQLIGLKVPQSHSWERSFADGVDPNLPFDLTEERVPSLLEKASDQLPATLREPITRLLAHMKELDRQVNELEAQIKAWHRSSTLSQRVAQIPGIGLLGASALMASIADARSFANGRQTSAWLGLVPRQNSSGGKSKLLSMSKRGDTYLRTLLVHGARSAILADRSIRPVRISRHYDARMARW